METGTVRPKRLYKSRQNRMIDGVCGGISEYFGIDPTILRVLWVLSIFVGGTGIWLYIAGMIIMPVNPEHQASDSTSTTAKPLSTSQRFWGFMLIIVGLLILLTNLGVFAFFHFWHISWTILFALLLIILGLYFILRSPVLQGESTTVEEHGTAAPQQPPYRRFERIGKDRKFLGVCGGIAKYFEIDPSIIRIFYVLFTIFSHGFGILLYFVLALILPKEEPQHA